MNPTEKGSAPTVPLFPTALSMLYVKILVTERKFLGMDLSFCLSSVLGQCCKMLTQATRNSS